MGTILNENGFPINSETKELVAKKVVSEVLRKESRLWKSVDKELPEVDQPVVIRFCSCTKIIQEDETSVYPTEDVKIGRLTIDGQWKINPPYPAYDYSGIADKENLLENTLVTHWAIPEEDEVTNYTNRFNKIRKYEQIELNVDSENEETVYRSLLYGAHLFIRYAMDAGDKMSAEDHAMFKTYYEVMCDLQSCIDTKYNTTKP